VVPVLATAAVGPPDRRRGQVTEPRGERSCCRSGSTWSPQIRFGWVTRSSSSRPRSALWWRACPEAWESRCTRTRNSVWP